MYASEFIKMFTCGEVKPIRIEIDGQVRDLHLRRLSYHECSIFRRKCQSTVRNATLATLLSIGDVRDSVFSVPDEDIELGEFYLIRKSLCDPSGVIIFESGDEGSELFSQWRHSVNDEIANAIIKEIDLFNNLSKKHKEEGADKVTTVAEDVKKK